MQSNPPITDCLRHFSFNDTKNCSQISVDIKEKFSASYGHHVWPSAPVLAQFVSYYRDEFNGKSVLELGSGTGIVGVVLAKVGANVVITDTDDCLELCRQNVAINRVEDRVKEVVALNWGHFDRTVVSMPAFDYIISSDCFYNELDFEDILSSVSYLLDKHPNQKTVFYTTYEERNSDWSIECLLNRWGLKCRYICLNDFEANDRSERHSIHLLKINKL